MTIQNKLDTLVTLIATASTEAEKEVYLQAMKALTETTMSDSTPKADGSTVQNSNPNPKVCQTLGCDKIVHWKRRAKGIALCKACEESAKPAPIVKPSTPSVKVPSTPSVKSAPLTITVKTLDQVKPATPVSKAPCTKEPTKTVESAVKADFIQTPYGVKLSVCKPDGRWLSKGRMRALGARLRAQFGPGYQVVTGADVPKNQRGMYVPAGDLSKVVEVVSAWAEPFRFEKNDEVIEVQTSVDWS